jgi:hypothetical protein
MRRTLLLLAAATLAAAHPAAAQDRTTSQGRGEILYFRLDVPFAKAVMPYAMDQVWKALPDAYQLLGFTARASADSTKKEVATAYMAIRGQLYPGEPNSRYFECGRASAAGALADQGDITFAMTTQLQPDERGGTAVLTQVNARVKRRDASQYPVDCMSTGLLERTMAQFLTQRLATPGTVEIRPER